MNVVIRSFSERLPSELQRLSGNGHAGESATSAAAGWVLRAESTEGLPCVAVQRLGRRYGTLLWPSKRVKGAASELSTLAQAAMSLAYEEGLELLHSLVELEDQTRATCLRSVGFTEVTCILPLLWEAAQVPSAESDAVGFTRYDVNERRSFLNLIDATFAGSYDFPELGPWQTAEDVAAGPCDAWFEVNVAGRTAGVLLLADVEETDRCELKYFGVLPDYRGRGVGKAIVRQAQLEARHRSRSKLSAVVDIRNDPAIAIYVKQGFLELPIQRVFFVTVDRPSA